MKIKLHSPVYCWSGSTARTHKCTGRLFREGGSRGGRASTAAMSGVRPMLASAGVSGPEPSTSAKNATPVISSTVGVMMAATPHPYCAAPRARQPRASRASASASGRVSMLHERGVPGMRDAKQWRPLAHARRTRLPAPGAAAAAAAAGGGRARARLAEDEARQQHHDERDGAGRGREVAHERGVVVGVGELRLDLALPRDLHQVDADAVRDHLRAARAQGQG